MFHSRLSKYFVAMLVLGLMTSVSVFAAEKKKEIHRRAHNPANPVYTDPNKTDDAYAFQGEYTGTFKMKGKEEKFGARVIARGPKNQEETEELQEAALRANPKLKIKNPGKPAHAAPANKAGRPYMLKLVFYVGGLPGDGWNKQEPVRVDAPLKDGAATFTYEKWTAKLTKGELTISETGGNEIGSGKRVERQSPTLGEKPPKDAIVLFDGHGTGKFILDDGNKFDIPGYLPAGARTKENFKDFKAHLEFRLPYMPYDRTQHRGNSGIYLQDRYEVQILDSFGLLGWDNECGGLYEIAKPKENMCYPPLTWQTYDIDFTAARWDGKKKVKDAHVKVLHNGVEIQDVDLPKHTAGNALEETPADGPIYLQYHGNPVVFRNFWVVEKK